MDFLFLCALNDIVNVNNITLFSKLFNIIVFVILCFVKYFIRYLFPFYFIIYQQSLFVKVYCFLVQESPEKSWLSA